MRPSGHSFLFPLVALLVYGGPLLFAQASSNPPSSNVPAQTSANAPLTDRERMLLDRVASLEQRVEALETKLTAAKPAAPAAPAQETGLNEAPSPAAQIATNISTPPPAASNAAPGSRPAVLPEGTTLNLDVDTYYGYNFNNPIGRVNLLRPYDVSSNAISLNQAGLILDNQADPAAGKRWGFRFDLQFGQATETLQGSSTNEPRPELYRNIFQAYGTYVLPIGKGLSVDFGKFASSLGYEGNYSKDQINYSRAFWFDFLPFYHMGARLNYKFSDKLAVNYWLVNGTQQTEPFNGYKDELFGFVVTPNQNISWTVNYYLGQEHPDTIYFNNGGAPPNAPTLQGTPFLPIVNSPKGKLDIFDSYLSWQANPKWLFAVEGDDEISRLYESSAPIHTIGGVLYAQYQWTPKLAIGGRAEYLSDRGGLYSGVTQAAKETTFTTKYALVDGFDIFGEWRRDFSNQPYFYTSQLGVLKREQNTATLGLVWFWGGKQGAW